VTFTPRTWVVGEVVTAALLNTEIRDQLNSMFDVWTTYTPTWTASTNPALGNGTLTGRYIKIGRTVTVSILLTCGSTTTYGSGAYAFGLPFPAAAATVPYLGSARLTNSATWHGQASLVAGGSSFNVTVPTSATNSQSANMSGVTPETLASGASIRATLTYQSAS
jgi:hypothetical protein